MPTISADQRTYTFQIRNDYQFSPPATGFVTAQSMKYTFERTLEPRHGLACAASSSRTSSERVEYHNGQANEITGIVASGDTLTIQLIQPQGDFLTFLAMPFTVRGADRPPARRAARARSRRPAPTTSRSNDINQHLDRDPQSQLPRPAAAALRRDRVRLQPERGDGLPAGPVRRAGLRARFRPPHVQEVADLYGPDSPAAARGLQQFFVEPIELRRLHAAEHRAPDVRGREHAQGGQLRDRPHGVRGPGGAVRGDRRSTSTSRRACRATRTSRPIPIIPTSQRARDLAGWHPGDPLRPITVYYRSSGTVNPAQYQIVRQQPRADRLRRDRRRLPGGNIYDRIGHSRRAVRPRRERRLVRGLPRPVGLHAAPRRDDDPRRQGNINWSYFDDPSSTSGCTRRTS